jgi:hypothetical protein
MSTISTIPIEPESGTSTGPTDKEKFAKRFNPTNIKQNKQSNAPKRSSTAAVIVQPLRADNIKEHRIWALVSLIFCFFLIAPIVAFYHSRRVRQMKTNQELTRAKLWSDRVANILVFSNIVGVIVWVAIIFVIAVLCILGHFY